MRFECWRCVRRVAQLLGNLRLCQVLRVAYGHGANLSKWVQCEWQVPRVRGVIGHDTSLSRAQTAIGLFSESPLPCVHRLSVGASFSS